MFKKILKPLFFKRYLKFIVEENKKELVPEIIKRGKEGLGWCWKWIGLNSKFPTRVYNSWKWYHSFTSNQTVDEWLKTHHKGTSLKKIVNEMKNYVEKK